MSLLWWQWLDNTGAKAEGKQGQNIYKGNPDTDTFPCVVRGRQAPKV